MSATLYSPEAEATYLGCCLNLGIAPECDARHFYLGKNMAIASAMVELSAKGEPIDLVTVMDRVRASENGTISAAEIVSLAEIAPLSPSERSLQTYRKIISDFSSLRHLQRQCLRVLEELKNPVSDVAQYLQRAESDFSSLSSLPDDDVCTAGEAMAELVAGVDVRINSGRTILGVCSGFIDLDRFTSGWCPGELIIIAARPSIGKTALACSTARHVAQAGHKVLFFSVEMGKSVIMRMAAQRCQLNVLKIRTGSLDKFERGLLDDTLQTFSGYPIIISHSSSNTELDIKARVRREKPELVIVDYLQLLRCSEGGDAKVSRERQISIISAQLKSVARDHNIPVIALSQLNREVEKTVREPRLSDLRDSGSIEQDADIVIFLHSTAKEDGYRDAIIAKNRNGPTGRIRLAFLNECADFRNHQR